MASKKVSDDELFKAFIKTSNLVSKVNIPNRAELTQLASVLYMSYEELVKAGFDKKQALELLIGSMTGGKR